MKEWEVIFLDQKGVKQSLRFASEREPSFEAAAHEILSKWFPVTKRLDLNDFEDRNPTPTLELLKEQHGVTIHTILEAS
ncbi:hypothetical protein ACE1YR_09270 [Pseudomonas sp. K1(2024)]|uniref:Uncharacterized protein n=2 Tax=Pseudomonas TaxID=286 RepID=A0AAI8KDL6_9PSED|nr:MULTISPECIES: hypothetical protein [Pseudomonas]AIZ33567.1 hypothetical protein NJ69_11520 [Pseudomonas parafulva]AXO89238.1 hypothetical protein DZC75_14965 [Pseudomonas parafulva]MDO7901287.1 hypothetical protein [Pseudomonas sp. K13]MDV9033970.1 hypothetical protein [Pseudomonas sp. RAC1]